MAVRLILVRHGLSSFNLERRIQGRNDLSTLTPIGQDQAFLTGKALSELSINAIYSSPLKRASETTKNIIKSFNQKSKLTFDEGLLEIELGQWSGMTINEVKEQFPEDFKTWKQQPEALTLKKVNGTEFKPIKDLINQADKFVKKIIRSHPPEKEETILLIAHNAIIRALILILLRQPTQGFRRLQLDNASISIFNLKPSKTKAFEAQIECLNNTCHLNQGLPKKTENPRVLLVRHGETNWNSEGRFQGQIDIPLNNTGKAQASAAQSFLSKVSIDKAFSSSMTRPKETAELILKSHTDTKLKLENGLIEIAHGLWEGKLESEIKEEWPELLSLWKESPQNVQMPEGETIKEVWSRSVQSWQKICSELKAHETALVVAHDAVNKTILCHLLGLTEADIWMVKQGNGCVSVIDINSNIDKPDLITCLNLTSHLGGLLDSTAEGAL